MELHQRVPQQAAVPPPPGETSDIRNPKDVLHTINVAIMIVVLCLTTPLFALRVYVRSVILRNMGREECKSQPAPRCHGQILLNVCFVPHSGVEFANRRDPNQGVASSHTYDELIICAKSSHDVLTAEGVSALLLG